MPIVRDDGITLQPFYYEDSASGSLAACFRLKLGVDYGWLEIETKTV